MSVVVLGDVQAVAAAAYVSAVSGRRVELVRPGAPHVDEVDLDGDVRGVEVVAAADLPSGPTEALLVVAQSRDLYELLRPLAFRLTGVPILLAPGGFAGALRVDRWFREWGLPAPLVAETTGFPVGGRVVDRRLTARSVKRSLPMAGLDEEATARLHAVFVRLLPQLVPSDLTTTSLSNTNHMIHPGVVLVNASRVDNGEPFAFYRSGISAAVGNLLHAVDEERRAVVAQVGGQTLGVREWMVDFYSAEGLSGGDIVECLGSFPPFAEVPGPTQLDYRYLVDDVPFGLAQWAVLARSVNLPVPHMDALLTMLRALAPELDLHADEQASRLFRQFLSTNQGVPA